MKLSYVLTAIGGVLSGVGICAVFFLLVLKSSDTNQDLRLPGDTIATLDFKSDIQTEHISRVSKRVPTNEFLSVRSLADTLAFESDFDQTVALYTLLAHADEAVVLDLIQKADSISPSSQKAAALSIIFSKYANIDPYRALKHAELLEEHFYYRMIPRIFHSWSRTNLEESLAAADALEGNRRRTAGHVILTSRDDLDPNGRSEIAARFNLQRELAEINRQEWLREYSKEPRVAWQKSIRSTDQKLQTPNTRAAIARAWITKEGLGVLPEIITTLPQDKERRYLVSNLAPWLARIDPLTTLTHISSLPNVHEVSVLQEVVFRAWGNLDHESAFEALHSMEVQNKKSISDRLLSDWASKDPRGLFEKANRMPIHFQSKARNWAITELARLSPHEAIARLDELPDLIERDDVAGAVARTWSASDPHSAIQWYLSLDMEYSWARRNRASRLTMRLTEKDPDLALRVATQTSGNLGSSMVSSVFSVLADTNVQVALQYVPRLNDEHKKTAMRSIGLEFAQADIREAMKLSGQLDESVREPYDEAVIDYVLKSSVARDTLIGFFDEISDQKLKNQAAIKLLYVSETKGYLSKAERRKIYSALNREQRAELDRNLADRHDEVYTGPIGRQ